jgi:hypothetical protein
MSGEPRFFRTPAYQQLGRRNMHSIESTVSSIASARSLGISSMISGGASLIFVGSSRI